MLYDVYLICELKLHCYVIVAATADQGRAFGPSFAATQGRRVAGLNKDASHNQSSVATLETF
jgi:hypothetical protein